MKSIRYRIAVVLSGVLAFAAVGRAVAEVGEIKMAQQYGLAFLPLMVMQHHKLFEKRAKAAGLGEVKVSWVKLASGGVMNDALLSGDLSFASGGVPPFITLWAKTRGTLDVEGVCAMAAMPLYLNTRNPSVKSVKDFTGNDRIAVPAIKVSNQAMFLQMAAEQAFGAGNAHKLDSLTVSLSHPDAMTSMLSGGEINSHFAAPPFQYQELAEPGVHTVVSSYDLLGGPHTFAMVWTTAKFRQQNPKTYAAFLAAFEEADAIIARDKKGVAEMYLADTKSKDSVENILKFITAPGSEYVMTPKNTVKQADFMYRVGTIKVKPTSWKEMFFQEIHHLPGS